MKVRVAAAIIKEDKLLCLKYVYNNQEVYNLPGGNLELGETMYNCLSRELKEELEVEILVNEICAVAQVCVPNEYKLHIVYKSDIINGLPKINPLHTSALSFQWIPLEQIKTIALYPNIGSHLSQITLGTNPSIYLGVIDQKIY